LKGGILLSPFTVRGFYDDGGAFAAAEATLTHSGLPSQDTQVFFFFVFFLFSFFFFFFCFSFSSLYDIPQSKSATLISTMYSSPIDGSASSLPLTPTDL